MRWFFLVACCVGCFFAWPGRFIEVDSAVLDGVRPGMAWKETSAKLIEQGYWPTSDTEFLRQGGYLRLELKGGRVAVVRGFPRRVQCGGREFAPGVRNEVERALGKADREEGACHCFRSLSWRRYGLSMTFEGGELVGMSSRL